jgi:hypothetical protein
VRVVVVVEKRERERGRKRAKRYRNGITMREAWIYDTPFFEEKNSKEEPRQQYAYDGIFPQERENVQKRLHGMIYMRFLQLRCVRTRTLRPALQNAMRMVTFFLVHVPLLSNISYKKSVWPSS